MLKSYWRKARPWPALSIAPLSLFLLGTQAEPPVSEPPSLPAASSTTTPIYWQMTQTGDRRPVMPEAKVCADGKVSAKMSAFAKAINSSGLQDCTHRESTAVDGVRVYEMSCKMKLGDALTMHTDSKSWERNGERFTRIETRSEGLGPALDKPHFTETRMVRLGECPANVKPGQYLLPDGEIFDPEQSLLHGGKLESAADKARLAAITPPPVVVTPVSRRVMEGRFEVECSSSRKWGRLKVAEEVFPFGAPNQRWRARPEIGVSALGEHLLIWHVDNVDVPVAEFDTEPNYTVRLGKDYVFTPPIAQHDSVTAHGSSPVSSKARARDLARNTAEERGETSCFLQSCFTSDQEAERFFKAFDRVAGKGGDLTISAVDAAGPVTMRYSLKGLGGILKRLEACTTPVA